MVADYKDLIVWQRSMDLVVDVYQVTRNFPADERFGLTNQLRRSSVSVPSNIAEGQGRGLSADFARFCRIANGSRQEMETQLLAAHRLGFIADTVAAPLLLQIEELGRLLSGLRKSIDV